MTKFLHTYTTYMYVMYCTGMYNTHTCIFYMGTHIHTYMYSWV